MPSTNLNRNAVMIQGTRTGVPLTVYPGYLLCSLGILFEIITRKYPRVTGLSNPGFPMTRLKVWSYASQVLPKNGGIS